VTFISSRAVFFNLSAVRGVEFPPQIPSGLLFLWYPRSERWVLLLSGPPPPLRRQNLHRDLLRWGFRPAGPKLDGPFPPKRHTTLFSNFHPVLSFSFLALINLHGLGFPAGLTWQGQPYAPSDYFFMLKMILFDPPGTPLRYSSFSSRGD